MGGTQGLPNQIPHQPTWHGVPMPPKPPGFGQQPTMPNQNNMRQDMVNQSNLQQSMANQSNLQQSMANQRYQQAQQPTMPAPGQIGLGKR